ncbi:MAG: hypothetical protein CL484_00605 [Acidobacteria bacterium]|nr:hypothetical protein [Acidobacteriota bacterium]|tara:strand:- start:380 stop:982 length:603 start_codon:yes stop_codon:yes gene_type:complete
MTELDLPQGLRRAKPEEWKLVGDITAEAFAQDPVASWTFGNVGGMRVAFQALARYVYIPRGICHLANNGATMWLLPGESKALPLWAEVGLGLRVIQESGLKAVSRSLTADARMKLHRPTEPHFYWFTIGVLEAARGQGLASKLMDPMLALADREDLPVYLENTNPVNTSIYESQGFVRQEIFYLGDGGPPLEAMIREPTS